MQGADAEEMLKTESDPDDPGAQSSLPFVWSPSDSHVSPVTRQLRVLNHARSAARMLPCAHAAASLEALLQQPSTDSHAPCYFTATRGHAEA